MIALFKAEFIRYQKWALLLFGLQLMIWFYLSKVSDLLDANNNQVLTAQLLLVIMSFAFGVLQMQLHKRKSHWTQLLQRPLSSQQIYISLAGAATAIVIIAIPLAWLFVVAGLDIFTNTIVDVRHYVFIPFIAGVALLAYLFGSFVTLSASRGAILLVIILLVFVMPSSQSLWLKFILMVLSLAYLFYLNVISFKPDLNQYPSSTIALFLMAIPMQMTIVYLLVFSSVIFYHIPLAITGEHPSMTQSHGTYDHWRNNVAQNERISTLLAASDNETTLWYGEQSKLAQYNSINTDITEFASQGQLHISDKQYRLKHKNSNTIWMFSHDEMLLQGSNIDSGSVIGWLGKQGFIGDATAITNIDRFSQVPFLLQDKYIVTDNAVFQVDYDDKLIWIKTQLQGNEQYIGLPQFTKDFVSLVSSKQTYLFDRRAFVEEFEIPEPMFTLPHLVSINKINKIETYHMVDGFILSYMGQNYFGFDRPGVEVIYAQLDGNTEKVHAAEFTQHSYPALIRHLGFIASPLYSPFYRSFINLGEPVSNQYDSLLDVYSSEMPLPVNVLIIGLQLFSAITVLLLAKRIRLSSRRQFAWVVMTLLVGLPSLISFFLLNKTRDIAQENPT